MKTPRHALLTNLNGNKTRYVRKGDIAAGNERQSDIHDLSADASANRVTVTANSQYLSARRTSCVSLADFERNCLPSFVYAVHAAVPVEDFPVSSTFDEEKHAQRNSASVERKQTF